MKEELGKKKMGKKGKIGKRIIRKKRETTRKRKKKKIFRKITYRNKKHSQK